MSAIRVVDYSRSPGGRYAQQGPASGEEYRDTILQPALTEAIDANDVLHVELDGTSGYGSSFLEEAFGGLVRKRLFSPEQIQQHLVVEARTRLFAPYAVLGPVRT